MWPREQPSRKEDCPHHTWDEFNRPNPPAGYCGPYCHMRPTSGPQRRRRVVDATKEPR